MIDIKEILSDFEPVELQNLNTDYGISGEKAGLAVALYNKALKKMNDGCYDLARIDLRKSVNLYPDFADAAILLGVCVFANGDRSEAVGIFNSIRGEERERALDYLDKLHEISMRPESAGVRNNVRSSRIPEGAYGNENKLDEIMRRVERSKPVEDDIDSDMKVVSMVSEKETSADETYDTDDNGGADVVLEENDDENSDNSAVEEISVDAQSEEAQDNISGDETEKSENTEKNDEVSEYSAMRPASVSVSNESRRRERFQRAEGQTSRPADVRRRQSVSGQIGSDSVSYTRKRDVSSGRSAEDNRAAKQELQKKTDALNKANRVITNLKIKNARANVLAIIAGLVCLILIIALICVTVSNGKLKKEIESLSNSAPTNSGTGNQEATPVPDNGGNPESNSPGQTAANQELLKVEAETAYKNAIELYNAGKYYECAETLYAVDLSCLDAADKTNAEKLYSDSVNEFANEYFNLMYSSAGKEDWEAVIEYGGAIYKHYPAYPNAALFFQIGKAYEYTGDTEKAKEFYNMTINNYPSSDDAGYAQYRLSEIS